MFLMEYNPGRVRWVRYFWFNIDCSFAYIYLPAGKMQVWQITAHGRCVVRQRVVDMCAYPARLFWVG